MAQQAGLDLVEVSPDANPPVCRIMDFGKYLYEQKRKQRESRKKTHHTDVLKEIRLRPETDKHDVEVKVNHAREFFQKGYRVQFTLVFRGRQLMHTEQGYGILNNIIATLEDVAKVDSPAKMTSRRLITVLVPQKITHYGAGAKHPSAAENLIHQPEQKPPEQPPEKSEGN